MDLLQVLNREHVVTSCRPGPHHQHVPSPLRDLRGEPIVTPIDLAATWAFSLTVHNGTITTASHSTFSVNTSHSRQCSLKCSLQFIDRSIPWRTSQHKPTDFLSEATVLTFQRKMNPTIHIIDLNAHHTLYVPNSQISDTVGLQAQSSWTRLDRPFTPMPSLQRFWASKTFLTSNWPIMLPHYAIPGRTPFPSSLQACAVDMHPCLCVCDMTEMCVLCVLAQEKSKTEIIKPVIRDVLLTP